jgi:hypothetical protein
MSTEQESAPKPTGAPSPNITAAEDTTQPPQNPAGDDHGLHWMALPISGGRR